MISHKAAKGDPMQTIVVADAEGTIFVLEMRPTNEGHEFRLTTNNPLTPQESLAHNLLVAAADVLHDLGYPGAIDDAVEFTLNLAADAFAELNKALAAADDEIPF